MSTAPLHCTDPTSNVRAANPPSGVRGAQLMWLAVLGAVSALILLAGLSGLGPPSGRSGGAARLGATRPMPGLARTHLTRAPLGLVFDPHTQRWTCVGTGHEPARRA